MTISKKARVTLHRKLNQYAIETMADMSGCRQPIVGDYRAAVRAMRDDSTVVAEDLGCEVQEVDAWCAAVLES